MALFGSVSGKQIDEFAKNLALELSKRYPAALDKGGERRISQKRLTTILEDTFNRAIEFKQQHKLGVYKKARLGQIKGFTGVDDPYEEPLHPELVVKTAEQTPQEIAADILLYLQENGYLKHR